MFDIASKSWKMDSRILQLVEPSLRNTFKSEPDYNHMRKHNV